MDKEYIEREALLSHLFSKQDEPLDVMKEIAEFPAADAIEALSAKLAAAGPATRGKWIPSPFNGNDCWDFYNCSNCGERVNEATVLRSNCCPNCGARMEGGKGR